MACKRKTEQPELLNTLTAKNKVSYSDLLALSTLLKKSITNEHKK